MFKHNSRIISVRSMRKGWTVIELIFIIIIIGILSSIAIGKLLASRDDAKLSTDISNMNICIKDVIANYTSTNIADINSISCKKVQCYTIDLNGSVMNVEINESAVSTLSFCADIENVGGHLAQNYQLAGSSIKR